MAGTPEMAANRAKVNDSLSGQLYKMQCRGVHAVALAGRPRAIVEDMAEVRVAAPAGDRGPIHPQAGIASFQHVFSRDGLPEAGPARARLELGR